MNLQELETAVKQLSKTELNHFSIWFEEFVTEQWDQQIEADINAGHLDAIGKQVDQDFEVGRCTQL